MRRKRGAGTVIKIGAKYHARRRVNGMNQYGPARENRDDAERDRLQWAKTPNAPITGAKTPVLGDWAIECLSGAYGDSIAPETLETRDIYRRRWLNPHPIARKRVDRITRADCQSFIDSIYAEKRTAVGIERRTASPAYVRTIAAFLSKLLTLAMRAGYIDSNPASALILPKIPERENRVLTPAEVLRLMNPTDPIGVMMLIAAHCGLRRGEIARIRWGDIDRRQNILFVRGQKTARARRAIPVTAHLIAMIDQIPRTSDFVFTGADAKTPIRPDRITKLFAAFKSSYGIPPETRLHDLRGSFTSILLESGTSVRTIMELLGHADPRMTLKAYARSNQEHRANAVQSFAETIAESAQKTDRVSS